MKESTKDEARGKAHELKGKLKEKAGQLTNNPDLEAEGQDEKTAGKVQKKVGQVEKVLDADSQAKYPWCVNGSRACPPVTMTKRCLPEIGLGSARDQVQSQVAVCRELLMTISCFSTVSPGRKLWPLPVKRSPGPAM